jgi:hypothetical protein
MIGAGCGFRVARYEMRGARCVVRVQNFGLCGKHFGCVEIVLVVVLVLVLDAVVLFSISRTRTSTRTIGAPLILRYKDEVPYEVSGNR